MTPLAVHGAWSSGPHALIHVEMVCRHGVYSAQVGQRLIVRASSRRLPRAAVTRKDALGLLETGKVAAQIVDQGKSIATWFAQVETRMIAQFPCHR